MNILELSEQEILRRQSLDELRKMGINPYPAAEYTTNAFPPKFLTVSVTMPLPVKYRLPAA